MAQIAAGHLLVYPLDLARASGRSPGSVYRECERMAKAGWLQRANVPGDIAYRGGEQLWRTLTAMISGHLYEGEQASRTISAASDSLQQVARRLERAVEAARRAGEQPATTSNPAAQGDAP